MFLADASAIVDYLTGTEKGARAGQFLSEFDAYYVCPITFAEIARWCNEKGLNTEKIIATVLGTGIRAPESNIEIEKRAGELCAKINSGKGRHEQKVSLIDCIVAATAEYYSLTVIATDPDFELFPQEKIVIT